MNSTTLFDNCIDKVLDKERCLRASHTSIFIVDEALNLLSVNSQEIHDAQGKRMRPGDYLGCINAAESIAGCGTHEYCKFCKLRNSVKEAMSINRLVMDECTLTQKDNNKIVIENTITPFIFKGKKYAIIFAVDISARKQEQVMDRVFFHDVLNLMGALNGFVQLLLEEPDQELLNEVKKLSEQVINDISYQKDILNAENNSLALLPTDIKVKDFVEDANISLNSTVQHFHGKLLINNTCDTDVQIRTDVRLLHRIILNMVKNAVEAAPENGTVTVTVSQTEAKDAVTFSVNNPGVIPAENRSKIFRFGQSSKGTGRGLGTYSMKQFGENYLKGHIWFTTDEENGTTFFYTLPLNAEL